jgi:hypothetical protein
MKRFITIPLLVLVLLLSACGGKTATPTPAPTGKTGITGQVFLAECQGDQIAADCFSQEPYQATLILYDGKMEEIARVLTAEDGTFEYELEAGLYFLHPESLSQYPIATDYQFTVVAGELTEITVIYDSGVR